MRHIDIVKKAFVFTDIKDFTLKNSLLTQLQIRDFLNKQDDLVFPIIEKYNGTVVKTIGDAYMILFDDIKDALNASIDIQKSLADYNSNINFNLHKIELRIIVNYGELQKEQTIIGEDYFGDIVNIAARLQYSVDENKVYVTKNVIDEIKDKKYQKDFNYIYLGNTFLRGVLYEIEVYEVLYKEDEIELLKDGRLKDEKGNTILLTQTLREKIIDINNIILEFSLITALAGMVNIPYIGLYIMLPFHFLLLKKIANRYGIMYLTSNELKTIFCTMISSLGGIFLISQFDIYIDGTNIEGFSGYITFVLNLLLSFLIGKKLSCDAVCNIIGFCCI